MKTVTIGIPAHNEASGIERMLLSVLAQQRTNYYLDRIVVACDGCTDNTADVVHGLMAHHPEIELINDGKRMGQIGRLNQFYTHCTSDIFITFDGDIELEGTSVVDTLVQAFTDEQIGLVGGEGKPRTPRLFWEKVFVTWIEVWAEMRRGINGGDSVHNHQGCISAVARPLYQKLEIPKEAISNDEYLYFRTLELGYRFVFAEDAVVRYTCPTTLRDNLKQSARFISTKYRLESLFSFDILPYYCISFRRKALGLVTVFFRKPLWTIMAVVMQVVLRFGKRFFVEEYRNGLWTQVQTSK
jgi:cellulose synthase/poly-beta-1,6-N-acetylglucosamine synthase-like glycosyltransferase